MKLPQNIEENIITYLEAARVAIADADIFDHIAEQLDISDEELIRLREDLQKYLGSCEDELFNN
jgi:hypothetical protein